MLDSIIEPLAKVLNFFYSAVPNFAIAISLMTILVMIVTTPLTLKGTKSMIKLQLLQPEVKRIQNEFREDRQKMNEEMMAFYQENQVNPVGGCLPLLIQAPVFLLLFRLVQGLTRRGADGTFDPKYLDTDSELYHALEGREEMVSFGLDLARSTTEAMGESIIIGFPYLILIGVMTAGSYLQQKQVSARNPDGSTAMPQQKMLLRIMPVFFAVISIGFPAALVVYWVTSNLYRIGLQYYITKSLYSGDDSLGNQATKVTNAARKAKESESDSDKPKGSTKTKGEGSSSNGKASGSGKSSGTGKAKPKAAEKADAGEITSRRVTPKAGAGKPHSSSKKKNNKRKR